MWIKPSLIVLPALVLAVGHAAWAQQAYFSMTGEFPSIGDQHHFGVDLSRPVGSGEALRFEALASGGGTNAAGQSIPDGGIDSLLELFDSGNNPRGVSDDAGSFFDYDALLSWPGVAPFPSGPDVPLNPDPLPAGGYRLELSAPFNNDFGPWALDIVGPADALALSGETAIGAGVIQSLAFGTTGAGADLATLDVAAGGAFSVSGPIAVAHGRVTLGGGAVNAHTLQVAAAGVLRGHGQVTADLTSDGETDPGDRLADERGILNVNGAFSQTATGALHVSLDGTDNSAPANPQFDQLLVTGSATLGGALAVTQATTPALGDRFDVLIAAQLTGGFDQTLVTGTALADPTTALALLYVDGDDADALADRVRLFATYAGDTNGDGEVSLVDLDVLGVNFGMAGTWQTADFNYDGVVSLADLDRVGANFGKAIAAPTASELPGAGVPEPATLALAVAGLVFGGSRRRLREA